MLPFCISLELKDNVGGGGGNCSYRMSKAPLEWLPSIPAPNILWNIV